MRRGGRRGGEGQGRDAQGEGEGGRFRLHETSRFRREDGAWVYVDGDVG